MKNTNKTKLGSTLLALALIFILAGAELFAQNFISNGTSASYQAQCGGVIKMKNVNSQFQNTNGATLGTSLATAIQGVVDWAATTPTQNVQGLYYERMVISGNAAKNIQDGVYIVAGACANPVVGYSQLTTYPFYTTTPLTSLTFNGTFHYTGTEAQNIYPVYNAGGGNVGNYYILDLTSTGGSTIRDNESVGAYNVTTAANSPLTVTGDLYLGAGNSDFNGTVTLNNANASIVTGSGNISFDNTVTLTNGAIEGNGTGDVTFTSTVSIADGDINLNTGSGDFTFGGAVSITGSGGSINLGSNSGSATFNSTIGITGGGQITLASNSGPATFNDDFNLTNGSLTASDNAGDVTIGAGSDFNIGSQGSISFGNNTELYITGTISNAGDGTNLTFNCGSTTYYNGTQNPQIILPTLNQNNKRYGNLILSNGPKRGGTTTYTNDINLCGNFALAGGNLDMYTNSGILRMVTVDATATYTGNYEVEGQFERYTDNTGRSYTFNNAYTSITLGNDTDNPALMRFNIRGGQNPLQYNANTDVNRNVILTYEGGTGNDFLMNLQVGYKYDEHPTGGWTGLNTQQRIRFYEATSGGVEKIGTGQPYTISAAGGAGQFGSVSLANIARATSGTLPNDNNKFYTGNTVLLRTGATPFISVDDGRWTNPNTWDEAQRPGEDDNVFIRHMVYVGIDGPFAGTAGGADNVPTNNTFAEADAYGTNPSAYTITIEGGYANASLIIGNEDNGDGYVFKTKATTGTTFMNNNTVAPTADFPIAAKGSFTNKTGFNGLWLVPWGSSTTRTTIFSTREIENKGTIRNEGIIEIGE